MRLLLVGSLVVLVSCVPAPKKAYSTAEISSIDSLQEVMRVQAQQADPLFSIRSQETFSDAEFEQMITVAGIIDATSAHLGEKFAGESSCFEGGFRASLLLAKGPQPVVKRTVSCTRRRQAGGRVVDVDRGLVYETRDDWLSDTVKDPSSAYFDPDHNASKTIDTNDPSQGSHQPPAGYVSPYARRTFSDGS